MPLCYSWHRVTALFITLGRESTNGEYLLPSGLEASPDSGIFCDREKTMRLRPHHAVLRIQHPRLILIALKKRHLHAKTLAEVVVDHRPQLFVIPKQNNLERRADTLAVMVVALVKAISTLKGYLYADVCRYLFMLRLQQPQSKFMLGII